MPLSSVSAGPSAARPRGRVPPSRWDDGRSGPGAAELAGSSGPDQLSARLEVWSGPLPGNPEEFGLGGGPGSRRAGRPLGAEPVHHGPDSGKQVLGLLGGAADRGHAEPAVDGDAGQHVEHHTGPGLTVELQAGGAYAIDDLTRGQPGPPRVPNVVRGAVVPRRSIGKSPSPVRVVATRQQTGQYDDGRGGAAPSQIHLEGVEPPLLTVVPGCRKVDAQHSYHLAFGKKPPDTLAVPGQPHGVVPPGRETAALVDLSVVPAQDLLVSCENHYPALGSDLDLDAGA